MADTGLMKNFTITHAMRSKFASLGSRLLKGDIKAQKQSIKEILDDEPDLVEPTLLLLQSGLMCDFLGNIKRRLPKSCTKIFLVPVRTMTKFIVSHSPLAMGDLKMLRKNAAKERVNILEQLFCFGIRMDREAPITEHDEEIFLSEMEIRHEAVGKPLASIKMSNDAIVWSECGCYKLAAAKEGDNTAKYTHVVHVATGTKVELPNERALGRNEGWTFSENWNERSTILKNGAEAIMINALFANSGAWDYSGKVVEVRGAKRTERAQEAAMKIEQEEENEEEEALAKPTVRTPAKGLLKRAASARFSLAPDSSGKKPRKAAR